MAALALSLAILALLALALCAFLLRERYRLIAERDVARARLADEAEGRARFSAVAGEVLQSSNAEFLRLAKEVLATRETHALAEIDKRRLAVDELVQPIREALERTTKEIAQVGQGHASLREQVQLMHRAHSALREETGKLSQALRKPNVRGRYGEIQLERVVELAGMRRYCDFTTQTGLTDREGGRYRPDAIVRLPSERCIAIDAKTSIDGYLDALDAREESEREAALDRYASGVLEQVKKLARKEYWAHLADSPELVVMFIPGDQLVDAALERQPKLIEYAAERNIVIASPSTLIGLLRAVYVGWREKSLSDRAEELFELGRELHERAASALAHADDVGQALRRANEAYNGFVASAETRLLPTLRRFEDSGARSAKRLPELAPITGAPRVIRALSAEEDELLPLPRPASREEAS